MMCSMQRDLFLYNDESKQMHVFGMDAAQIIPTFIDFEGRRYHGIGMSPGYYIWPPNESAFLNFCEWFIPQVLQRSGGGDSVEMWNDIYSQKLEMWQGFPEKLSQHLYPAIMNDMVVLKDGQIGVFENESYSKFLHEWLVRYVQSLPEVPAKVIEFGCGTGENLLALKMSLPQLNLFGVDVSSSAVTFAANASNHYNLPVSFFHTEGVGPHEKMQPHDYDLVFVHGVVHILKTHVQEILKKIFALSQRRVLIIEPIPPRSVATRRDAVTLAYYQARKFTTDILEQINKVASEEGFSSGRVEKLGNSGNPINECTALEFVRDPCSA